jgi:hypothetical protein
MSTLSTLREVLHYVQVPLKSPTDITERSYDGDEGAPIAAVISTGFDFG